jgi:hypothetical protein
MKYYILLIGLLFGGSILAQSNIYLGGILGHYAMGDMKKFQDVQLSELFASTGLKTAKELEFPISLQAEVGFDQWLNSNNSLGVFLNYSVTNGRLGYSDYSGGLTSAQNLSRSLIGVKFQGTISDRLGYYLKVGWSYSKLKLDYSQNIIGAGQNNSSVEFHSQGAVIQPGLYKDLFLTKKFYFQIQAGYEINLQGATLLDSDPNAYLIDKTGKKILIDWSGFRLGLLMGLHFANRDK